MTATQQDENQVKTDLTLNTSSFVAELDAAVEAHLEWTRRILRCVVLQTSPGEDVLDLKAHTLCHFGGWIRTHRELFELMDAPSAARVGTVHQTIHDAIRSICSTVLAGRMGAIAVLVVFEASQSDLIDLLARFKTLFLSAQHRIEH